MMSELLGAVAFGIMVCALVVATVMVARRAICDAVSNARGWRFLRGAERHSRRKKM
jgi:hypothetical protein